MYDMGHGNEVYGLAPNDIQWIRVWQNKKSKMEVIRDRLRINEYWYILVSGDVNGIHAHWRLRKVIYNVSYLD